MRTWAAATAILLLIPGCLLGQDRPMLHEAVFAVDGVPVASLRGAELVTCVWIATYGIDEGRFKYGALDPLPADSALLRISFYRDDEPSPTALEARDGSGARYHIAILEGDPPGVMSRKDPGYDGPYATPHVLSGWGELILATLRLPTRRENGAPSVRRFSASEVEPLRGRFSEVPTAAPCLEWAEEGALSWRSPG